MATGGITFGAAKADLATVCHNGISPSDGRVLLRTNEATKMLLDELIPVGGMATYDVVASGTTLLLPKELENAIEAHPVSGGATVNGQSDVKQGWFDLVSNFVYIDPSQAHDNPLVDQFLVPDPGDATILRRQYDYPGLTPNATVRVTGAKRFVPIANDGDYLIIQNVRALKLAILSIELTEKNQPTEGESYRQMALGLLLAEVKKHLLDPRNVLQRKYAYQADLTTYTEGTLGRTRARLALELTGFLNKGKSEITYLINRAVQMLVDNRNELAIAGRIQVHNTTTELAYAPANDPATVLAWPDYNQIRLMVQSFAVESPDPNAAQLAQGFQDKAFNLQHAQLIEQTEKLRHTTYTQTLLNAVPFSFGWMVARLALELPGGLQMTTDELRRVAEMAEMRLMQRGTYKGTIAQFTASVQGGELLFPAAVEAILAADICGEPLPVRSIFFQYLENGPGMADCAPCSRMLVDQGEVQTSTGAIRRKYKLLIGDNVEKLSVVAKLRWVRKDDVDQMTIRNFEAIRLMSQAILDEKAEKWKEAAISQNAAGGVLETELKEYLAGVQQTMPAEPRANFGLEGLGEPL